MERLTAKSILGGWTLKVSRQEGVDRLAAYEDTGMEPEEIVALAKGALKSATVDVGTKLYDLAVSNAFEKRYGITLDRMCELTEADKDGRCVVLPCKAGDTLWNIKAVFSFYPGPKEETVDRFVVSDDGVSAICRSGYKFRIERIGKTVFLTNEAAEKALEAQKC